MTAAVYHLPDDVSVQRRQRWLAVGLSVLLHGLLALFLLGNRMSTCLLYTSPSPRDRG